MVRSLEKTDVYLEVGKIRTFAGAIEWPGWCRSGRDAESALQALFDYGPRYARVLSIPGLGFKSPGDPTALAVIEHLEGTATTDFGAPGLAPSADAHPIDNGELARLVTLLKGCWKTFDRSVSKAAGKQLRKGPRGGGRELEAIVEHVLHSEAAYLARLGGNFKPGETDDTRKELGRIRRGILIALEQSAHGDMPSEGPRGGARWTARYFVRRATWHVLDHAWEIEDRVL